MICSSYEISSYFYFLPLKLLIDVNEQANHNGIHITLGYYELRMDRQLDGWSKSKLIYKDKTTCIDAPSRMVTPPCLLSLVLKTILFIYCTIWIVL